jgi:UDP-N-acetylmuramate dehydrogenase
VPNQNLPASPGAPAAPFELRSDVPLAPYTTLGLGGRAHYFSLCSSEEQVREALAYARTHRLRCHVLGGGSNTVFADEGFDGLVIKISIPGVSFHAEGSSLLAQGGAGEGWDAFVVECIQRGAGGLECLSGIPGLLGATPIQNVGAYGQEVSETITSVRAIDRSSLEPVIFEGRDCHFGYRSSRFKTDDANRYVLTRVSFRLPREASPEIRYPELAHALQRRTDFGSLKPGREALSALRTAVLEIRRRKSMVLDPADPNTKSAGSFFVNPVVSPRTFQEIQARWSAMGGTTSVPHFSLGDQVKVPAAWLVEQSGFPRGYRRRGAGISGAHALALINCGGTTGDLLALAGAIEAAVLQTFGLRLQREPVVV